MDRVDRLYENYNILSDSSSADRESRFLEILDSIKGEKQEKILASQFMNRFFKDFPLLIPRAVDAQLELLGDADTTVRMHAVRNIISMVKGFHEMIRKVAHQMAYMLVSNDITEINALHSSLTLLITEDAVAALEGFFQAIREEVKPIQSSCIHYLKEKLSQHHSDLLRPNVQNFILKECEKPFNKLSGEDFEILMSFMSNLKVFKTIPGQKVLTDFAESRIKVAEPFDDLTMTLISFLQHIRPVIPYYSDIIKSSQVVNYMCLEIMPKLYLINSIKDIDELYLGFLKVLAEISPSAKDLENFDACLEQVRHMILKHVQFIELDNKMEELCIAENGKIIIYLECLLFTFAHFLHCKPDFLNEDENSKWFADLKKKFLLIGVHVQACLDTLKRSLNTKQGNENLPEEKAKFEIMRSINNITLLIKDLLKIPPCFKRELILSWKSKKVESSMKRGSEETKVTNRAKKAARALYVPPGGKYSKNADYSNSSNFRERYRKF